VILVEKDKAATEVIKENIRLVSKPIGSAALITLQSKEVKKFLSQLAASYDLVFIDPPYELGNAEISENLTSLFQNLTKGALVIVERSSRTGDFEIPNGFELDEKKVYGDTAVYLLRFD
jgi:16S rRNA (guanine966-N2)-methyltransferase